MSPGPVLSLQHERKVAMEVMPPHSKVSVLLPVRNGEGLVREAVDSILAQSFPDLRLIVTDDGSTDSTPEILRSIRDPRLVVVTNEVNLGRSESLNRALREFESEYVARLDHDDIALPQRIEKQVRFMDAHPDVSICGGFAKTIGYQQGHTWRFPTSHEGIHCVLIFQNPVVHPSVIMRRADLLDHGLLYDTAFSRTEDYDLWERAAHQVKLANMPEVLVKYRVSAPGSRPEFDAREAEEGGRIRLRQLRGLGLDVTPEEERLHYQLSTWDFQGSIDFLRQADRWLTMLHEANRVYPEPDFSEVLADRLFAFCNAATHLGPEAGSVFAESELSRYRRRPLAQAHMAARCLVRWRRRGSVPP